MWNSICFMCKCVFTWGCRVLLEEVGWRGPVGHSYSSSMEYLKCWWAWRHCCWGSEGRLAVCEWVCVHCVSVCAKERETGRQGERERERGTVTGIDTLKIWSSQQFSQSVSQSGTICSVQTVLLSISTMKWAVYCTFSDAPVLTGAHRKTGRCAV